ncbi:ABC transporter ATP-binding protein [Paenibacillus tepidiphilus]|uniref:ABC transporter ATP-binding protein n=1 Tax=Paenibacillus tepidiphilus TaxID=2608683 RepID=UPI0012386269|nr:ABC transporter ATP-binding protein [Paenibacillus tepidiphilus]
MKETTHLKHGLWPMFRRLLPYSKPYKLGLGAAVLTLAAKLVFDVGFAAIQQVFIDTINSSSMDSLTRLTAVAAAACAIIIVCLMLQHFFRFMTQGQMSWDFRARLFASTNSLPFPQLQAMHSGDLTSRNTKDAGMAMGLLSGVIYDLGYNLLLCLVSFIYLARMDVWIAMLALGSGPVVFLCGRFFDRRLRRLSTDIYAKEGELRGILQETLQGMKVVRSFSLEEKLLQKYETERMKLAKMQQHRTLLNGLLWQSSALVNNLVMIVCAMLIAWSAVHGGTSAGGVLAFIILMGRVQWPFVFMSQTWGGIQEALGAGDRVFAVMDLPGEGKPEKASSSEASLSAGSAAAVNPPGQEYALSIEDLYFSYAAGQEEAEPLFSGIQLSIRPGETVAVVGPSGAGKTTLVRLCCGLYAPAAGQISVYGHPVQHELEKARSLITYVPQTPYLFSGTIRDNIAFGVDSADDGQIDEAVRLAGAQEFIHKLPQGLDTVIGEHGSTLSGGQRQRLAIARAFLRGAPLLLLDEATSALDNESERIVQQSLDLLMQNRTTLVIAHRLSTVRSASRIVVIDQGRIVEEGSHTELLERGGLYTKLYQIQFRPEEQEDRGSAELAPATTLL